jgi:collagen type V/XI/XXIV/XXVII, alpha
MTYQNFTYSVAWFNSNSENCDSSLKFLGDNDVEIGHEMHGVKPTVLVDGCRTGRTKSETVLEIKTKKVDYLPVIDFYPLDYGQQQQAFGFQMGPVCFK